MKQKLYIKLLYSITVFLVSAYISETLLEYSLTSLQAWLLIFLFANNTVRMIKTYIQVSKKLKKADKYGG